MIGALLTAKSHLYDTVQRSWYRLLLTTTRPCTWSRYAFDVPLHAYGAGSRQPFPWYFTGALSSGVSSLDDLRLWLRYCTYVRDTDQFGANDYWQHPVAFESLRKGDCEDFSLWAWRSLVEMGVEAEFVAGWMTPRGGAAVGHTWIHMRQGGETLVLDPVVRDAGRMIRPAHEVEHTYTPQVSVDNAYRRYVYGGYYRMLRPRWMAASGREAVSEATPA